MDVRKVFAKFYVGILVVLGLYVFFGSLIGVGIRKVVRENKESPKVVEAIQTEVEEEPTKDKVVETPIIEEEVYEVHDSSVPTIRKDGVKSAINNMLLNSGQLRV